MQEILQSIHPTSKAALKYQCLFACGNIKEAKEMYDFFVSDIKDLPDFDPVQPSFTDNAKNTMNGLMAWFKENQDTLAQGYSFIQGLIANRGIVPAAPIGATAEALPPIEE